MPRRTPPPVEPPTPPFGVDEVSGYEQAPPDGRHRQQYEEAAYQDGYAEDAGHAGSYDAAYDSEYDAEYEDENYADGDYDNGDYDDAEYDDAEYEDAEYDDAEYEDEYDDEEDRADPEYFADERDADSRDRGAPKKRRKRALGWVAAIAVIALLAGGAWYGINSVFGYDDFDGDGESDVLVQVADGDSANAIANKLADAGVVASAKAFVKASEDDTRMRSVQPGYYTLKTRMSGVSAVNKLAEPASRVGELQIKGGTQLDDIKQPNGSTTEGVLTQLSKASCAQLNGNSTCVPAEELRKVVETGDLGSLGIPQWAVADATKAEEKKRRIEGLIVPGVYDVKPGSDASTLLSSVLTDSAQRLSAAGLPAEADGQGKTPYQTLVIASLIEREGVSQDFEKVSRVIYNRLSKDMKLELDSTVNYVLDRPVVRTTSQDRARAGAYNTYQNTGLPPTPISAPSKEAIQAAENPAEGDWLFFVKCEKNGLSCFAATNEEHEQNKKEALARGAY